MIVIVCGLYLQIENKSEYTDINGKKAYLVTEKWLLLGKKLPLDEVEEVINIYEFCKTRGWVTYGDLLEMAETSSVARTIIEKINEYGLCFNNEDTLEFYISL